VHFFDGIRIEFRQNRHHEIGALDGFRLLLCLL
jgi:hypothetical protein